MFIKIFNIFFCEMIHLEDPRVVYQLMNQKPFFFLGEIKVIFFIYFSISTTVVSIIKR